MRQDKTKKKMGWRKEKITIEGTEEERCGD